MTKGRAVSSTQVFNVVLFLTVSCWIAIVVYFIFTTGWINETFCVCQCDAVDFQIHFPKTEPNAAWWRICYSQRTKGNQRSTQISNKARHIKTNETNSAVLVIQLHFSNDWICCWVRPKSYSTIILHRYH